MHYGFGTMVIVRFFKTRQLYTAKIIQWFGSFVNHGEKLKASKQQLITDTHKDLGLIIVNVYGFVFHASSMLRHADKHTDATKRIISPAPRSIKTVCTRGWDQIESSTGSYKQGKVHLILYQQIWSPAGP